MAKITGRVEILVNGIPLLNKEGFKAMGISVSGQVPVEREAVMGDGGLHGHMETTVPARCEGNITDRDDVSLSDLAAINGDGTVVFRTRGGGKVYTMYNATCIANLEVTGGTGETPIAFEGPAWVETTSS